MPTIPLHFAPGLLVAFMLALAVIPMAIVWFDERRRGRESERLAQLREDARLRATLALSAGQAEAGLRRGLCLPNR